MTATRAMLGFIAFGFVLAEFLRPTHVPAKRSSLALIRHSQAAAGAGTRDSLDPALLDDLPRIHPDAVGHVRVSHRDDGPFRLSGTIDSDDGGTAVFVESGGKRLGGAATTYGRAPQLRTFDIVIGRGDLEPGTHLLRVALISADARGFFLLPQPVIVKVGRTS